MEVLETLEEKEENRKEVENMKIYRVCIVSYFTNNSDYKEYDNYYTRAKSLEEVKEFASKVIDNWNNNSKCMIYHIYDIKDIQ